MLTYAESKCTITSFHHSGSFSFLPGIKTVDFLSLFAQLEMLNWCCEEGKARRRIKKGNIWVLAEEPRHWAACKTLSIFK